MDPVIVLSADFQTNEGQSAEISLHLFVFESIFEYSDVKVYTVCTRHVAHKSCIESKFDNISPIYSIDSVEL